MLRPYPPGVRDMKVGTPRSDALYQGMASAVPKRAIHSVGFSLALAPVVDRSCAGRQTQGLKPCFSAPYGTAEAEP
jgi:hypothetical protein